ncbi:MAG: NfeD family protein [Ignisphaera sp.]
MNIRRGLTLHILIINVITIVLILNNTIPFLALNADKRDAVIVDFSINVDGGGLHFWNRVSSLTKDQVVILKINSYGGYLNVADEIVSNIIENNITCYSWVPPGGYAVSAAAMISLACKRIFMGSGAVIGDAIPSPSDPKTIEYVASRFRALAEKMFNGNKTLVRIAEAMVREGKTLTTEEAISIGFAVKAETITDLEKSLNLSITTTISPSTWDRFVSLVSLPLISEVLLTAGVLLILVEIFTTGFQGYAIAGILLIVFALYGMNIIPPNILALILMLTGLTLVAIEMYTPGFGAFGLSGIVLLTIGIGYQFYTTPPQLVTESVYIVIGGVFVLMMFIGLIAFKAVEAMHKKKISLEQQLLSSLGIAKTDIHETEPGVVYILGEEWSAYSVKGVIPAGSKVKVIRIEGLKLYVEKLE